MAKTSFSHISQKFQVSDNRQNLRKQHLLHWAIMQGVQTRR